MVVTMIPADSLPRLRLFLMAILLLGLAGSTADLLLLAHHEDLKQLIPLGLLGGAFLVLAWHGKSPGRASVWALRAVMVLFVVSGAVGVVLHLQSTMEFQLEVDPSLEGAGLLLKALQAKAPPALAPGVMVQLGLLGLAFTYCHPALHAPGNPKTQKETE